MTCNEMLERMLDAEEEELLGHGDSPLANHVRVCDNCRAVAHALVAETHALAAAVASGPSSLRVTTTVRRRSARTTRAIAAASTLLAAAIIVFIVVRPLRLAGDRPSPVVAPHRADTSPAGVAAGDMRIAPERLAAAERIAAQPIDTERVASITTRTAAAQLMVRPPAGVRAAVLQTANPTITVVWLY